MNFKVFAAFFVALLAVQASNQTPLRDDSIKEIVVAVFKDVLNVTAKVLDVAEAVVTSLETNEGQIKDDIVAFAVEVGKELNKVFLEIVDGLKDGATDDGKAVLTCIDAEEDKTDAAFQKVATTTGNCIATEVELVFPEVKTIMSQLNDLQNDVQGQVDTLSSCSDAELTCLISFLGTSVTTIKKIPGVVYDDVVQILALVKTILTDVSGCEILPEIKESVQEIFNEAVVCIKS